MMSSNMYLGEKVAREQRYDQLREAESDRQLWLARRGTNEAAEVGRPPARRLRWAARLIGAIIGAF